MMTSSFPVPNRFMNQNSSALADANYQNALFCLSGPKPSNHIFFLHLDVLLSPPGPSPSDSPRKNRLNPQNRPNTHHIDPKGRNTNNPIQTGYIFPKLLSVSFLGLRYKEAPVQRGSYQSTQPIFTDTLSTQTITKDLCLTHCNRSLTQAPSSISTASNLLWWTKI